MKKIESLLDIKLVAQEVPNRPFFDPCACEGNYILDEQGNPVPEPDLFEWGKWLQANWGSRHLADDTVGPYRVSTIFLALDHRFGDGGPPVLWETIIFGMEDEMEIIPGKRRRFHKTVEEFRYTSKADALAGHASAVKLAQSLPHPVSPGEASSTSPSVSAGPYRSHDTDP